MDRSTSPTQQFKVYPKRYLIVGLFALVQMMTSCLLNTLTPIAQYLTQIYQQDPIMVNLGGLLYALMHPIFTFPAAFVIDTYGTRVGISVGCILGLIGTGIRLFVNDHFFYVIIGQIIAGIGRPFILNCQAKISANWFTAQGRGGITQLLTLILNVSLIIGIFIPGIVFGDYKPNISNPESIQKGKDLTFQLMLVQMIMGLCCYLPNILFQQSKPPTPASECESVQREPFSISMPKLLKNKNYLLLLLSFGLYFGSFNALSIVLSFILQPWFGGEDLPLAVGCVGGSPIISGIIGVMVIGPLQRKSGKFKKYIMTCMVGSLSAIVLFYPLLSTGNLFLASFISAYNSFFLIPMVPIMLELSCQLAFPVGEGAAVGLLFANGNFSGFLLGLLMSLIVQGETKGQAAGGLGFCFAVFLLGFGLLWFMKQQTNRMNYEKENSQKRRSGKTTNNQSIMLSEAGSIDKENLQNKLLSQQQNIIL